jgi:hypothetical protein
LVNTSYVIIKDTFALATDVLAILPAVVVVHNPVGIKVIWPPDCEIGGGGVIVAIAVVPDTNEIILVGAIVVLEAIVNALDDVATNGTTIELFTVTIPLELMFIASVAPEFITK